MINLIPYPFEVKESGKEISFNNINDVKKAVIYKENKDYTDEEYSLLIGDEIVITSSNKKGKFYAEKSLENLIIALENDGKKTLPICEIHDKPRYSHRGFMLDEARNFMGKEFVKQVLNIMASLKLNIFHWHLSDDQGFRIEIEKYPKLTLIGTKRPRTQLTGISKMNGDPIFDNTPYGEGLFYTKNDIREIVEYAKERNIDIIPEIDMPGHMKSAIACYPELSCFNENVSVDGAWVRNDVIGCAASEDFYKFAYDVIDELSQLFPYKYFHIGGDEAPKTKWEKCPHCQELMAKEGIDSENDLQCYFNNKIAKYLKTKGKTLIGWNEIIKGKNIDNSVVAQWWSDDYRENGVGEWLKNNNKIILSVSGDLYMDYTYKMVSLKRMYSLSVEKIQMPSEYEKNILGIEAPVWTEYLRTPERVYFNILPRLFALSEICWTSQNNKDYSLFEQRLQPYLKELDKKGITYAPKEIYVGNTEGVENVWDDFYGQPDDDFKKYKAMKNK